MADIPPPVFFRFYFGLAGKGGVVRGEDAIKGLNSNKIIYNNAKTKKI